MSEALNGAIAYDLISAGWGDWHHAVTYNVLYADGRGAAYADPEREVVRWNLDMPLDFNLYQELIRRFNGTD
jgi:spore coat polysaccharide biosynthesis protein SpsF (cytidylyltransferase family)